MNIRNYIPGLVVGSGALFGGAALLNLTWGAEPDYADLVPAPDAIVWQVDDETALWLSTNRHAVDVRVSSIDLGIGEIDIRDPQSGAAIPLGEGLGCLDAVVSELTITGQSENSVGFSVDYEIEVDRAAGAGIVEVWERFYREGEPKEAASQHLFSAGTERRTFRRGLQVEGAVWQLEASTDEHFPTAITRRLSFTLGADEELTDMREEEVHLIEETGVTMVACDEHEDVVISLHGDEGAELNRYLVDILAADPTPVPTATPSPTPTPVPTPAPAGHVERRICVDATTSRGAYLTGGENVGDPFAIADFAFDSPAPASVNYELADFDRGSGHRHYFAADTAGQLTVTDAGAGNTAGIDADRLYQVRLSATDPDGLRKYLDIAIWLDTSTESPNDDGLCS